MKKSTFKSVVAIAAAVLSSTPVCAQGVGDYDGYTVTRVSNPDCVEGEADGLVAGGDRENSYTWRMAMRGDNIYIATTRNIASALVNMYAPNFAAAGLTQDGLWTIIDAVTNGDILRNDANEGANIIAYDRVTGQFDVIYTADRAEYFRMAVTFGDDVYFGSYTADPSVPQYILKLDIDGNFTKVYQTTGSVSLRATCEYDGHLFFAGADDREEIDWMTLLTKGMPTKMAVLQKSNDDDTVWNRVADWRDFGDVAFDPIMSSWAGAPIWEMATHRGYIYATAPSNCGFVIFRGHPAEDGEEANDYGWHWEEVAGLNNGINNPGLSNVKGGEPGTMRSLIGSVYEFKGQLYAYNFDHSFGGEASVFAGLMGQLAGKDVKPSDYLEYMYNSLQNPQKVWRLNDDTGRFEELRNFTRLMEGTTNEYIWRLGEHDGQLYIATMDAALFYGYMTQLTNGNYISMSAEEWSSKLGYLREAVGLLASMKKDDVTEKVNEKLDMLKMLMDMFTSSSDTEEQADMTVQIENIISIVKTMIQVKLSSMEGETLIDKLVIATLQKIKDGLQDVTDKIDVEGAKKYLYINDMVRSAEPGFDLLRTSDGEEFEVITRTGFDDKYNYGCPSFLSTDEGLYIGTCNPFYGGQLYLLTNDGDDNSRIITGIDSDVATTSASVRPVYDLQGRAVSVPTRGLYVRDGKKIVVK